MQLDPSEFVFAIDVSHYQGSIDWTAAAQSGRAAAAWLKATESTGFVDRTYRRNALRASSAGVPFGPYHFARPSGSNPAADATAEAKWFAAMGPGTLPAMLDLESSTLSPAATAEWAVVFVTEYLARRPEHGRMVLYTSSLPNAVFADSGRVAARVPVDLWVARYRAGYAPDPDVFALRPAPTREGWSEWSLWQYTSSGKVPGIAGNVDRNIVRRRWLDKFATGAPAPQPERGEEMLTEEEARRLRTAEEAALRTERLLGRLVEALVPEGIGKGRPLGVKAHGIDPTERISNVVRWALEGALNTRADRPEATAFAALVAETLDDVVVRDVATVREALVDLVLEADPDRDRQVVVRDVDEALAPLTESISTAIARATDPVE